MVQLLNALSASPSLASAAVLAVVLGPVLVLVHECGHALAADLRVGGASVSVNWRPWCAGVGGFCAYDARHATRTDTIVIALAGPALSGMFGVVWWGLLVSAPHTGLWHDATWLGFMGSLQATFVNLLPLALAERRGGTTVLRLDGRVAWDAWRS